MIYRASLLAVLALVAAALGAELRGHSVVRVVPGTHEELRAVHQYLLDHPLLDVWAEPRKTEAPVDINVSPQQRADLVSFLERQGIEHEDFIEDLHSAVQTHLKSVQRAEQRGADDGVFGWQAYYRLELIYKWMSEVANADPQHITLVDVGNSYYGRPMKGLVIKFAENLPVAMLESGIHAREWITHASATFFIDKIVNSASDDIVRKYEWHIFPCVNPDGYAHTWDKNRNWRKTRSPHWLVFSGVDANRNWPFHWMEAGANMVPSSEIYGGPRAESEPETRNLRQYVDKLAPRMHVYVSLHSYSQLLMFPWGYTSQHVPTHSKLLNIAAKAVKVIESRNGTQFTYGNIADTIYPASGSTLDYVFSKCVPYPFVFELRDTGRYGFLLPPEQILDAAGETWAGVRVIVEEAYKAGVPDKNPSSC